MDTSLRHWDVDAHEPGCLRNDTSLPLADPGSAYVDIFCECHRFTEPKILSNGSDIAWPAGWDGDRAKAWRRQKGLALPPGLEAV